MKFLPQSVNGKDEAEDRRVKRHVIGQVASGSVKAETWEGVNGLASGSKRKTKMWVQEGEVLKVSPSAAESCF